MKRLKQRILNYILRNHFKAVVADDIITVTKDGRLLLNGVQMAEAEIKNLKEEVKYWERTRLHAILMNTLLWEAQTRMGTRATNWDDVFFGKASLHHIKVTENIVERIKAYQPRR